MTHGHDPDGQAAYSATAPYPPYSFDIDMMKVLSVAMHLIAGHGESAARDALCRLFATLNVTHIATFVTEKLPPPRFVAALGNALVTPPAAPVIAAATAAPLPPPSGKGRQWRHGGGTFPLPLIALFSFQRSMDTPAGPDSKKARWSPTAAPASTSTSNANTNTSAYANYGYGPNATAAQAQYTQQQQLYATPQLSINTHALANSA
ncbi:hypothetical protein C8F04DRAFT_1321205 [Mycena alexandri]|uniref:Uncharacterized protein n=1 Tax=Mycena alexandri TaxID=1745969 RepID=A0AAD6S3B0_9AGAR|nr:hypothetical protein C8F04DRAFT_1321205 [Mycena alexandri]